MFIHSFTVFVFTIDHILGRDYIGEVVNHFGKKLKEGKIKKKQMSQVSKILLIFYHKTLGT